MCSPRILIARLHLGFRDGTLYRMLTNSQCRAARALLAVRQDEVSAWSGVSKGTIANFELGSRTPIRANLEALRHAFEEHGVVFLDATDERGPGVALANPPA